MLGRQSLLQESNPANYYLLEKPMAMLKCERSGKEIPLAEGVFVPPLMQTAPDTGNSCLQMWLTRQRTMLSR